jgi:hypothetical protein
MQRDNFRVPKMDREEERRDFLPVRDFETGAYLPLVSPALRRLCRVDVPLSAFPALSCSPALIAAPVGGRRIGPLFVVVCDTKFFFSGQSCACCLCTPKLMSTADVSIPSPLIFPKPRIAELAEC